MLASSHFAIHKSIESIESIFCPLGKNIHLLLDTHFEQAQKALESYLKNIKLIDLLKSLQG